MQTFGLNRSVRRAEDPRLLTGKGRYVDDTAPAGALRAVVLRSTVAHGRIAALDVEAARAAEGVALVLTARDLAEAGLDAQLGTAPVRNRDGSTGATPRRPLLAEDKVRFVGEAVALIVADTLDRARDAAELIELDIETLDAKVDVAPGGPALHEDVADNVVYDWAKGDAEACAAALAGAAHRVELTVQDNRIICASMEPRGAWAEIVGGRTHICVNGQGVWGTRDNAARILGVDRGEVRVTTPDVGGGFGMKGSNYPETFLVAHAARVLGKPVRWMSDRGEAMLADNGGRGLIQTAELGFDADLHLVAYRASNVADMGAYLSDYAQNIQSELMAKVMPGVYDVQACHLSSVGVVTNTAQVDAYRGAGRPEAIFLLERAMDLAARQLDVDPFELRLRNVIRPEQFPYAQAMGETYDVGDFGRLLRRARDEADVDGFVARREASASHGRLRGIGLCYYIESILGNPTEHAEIEFTSAGGARLHVGTQSNGQGHETVYRQFMAEDLGLDPDLVEIVQGDSDRIATGGGTGGSRSVTTQGSANRALAQTVVAAYVPFVAGRLGAGTVTFMDGVFRAEGSNRVMTLAEAAEAAREDGRDDLLRIRETSTLPGRSYPNGAHVCEVEVDPDTGQADVVRYTVVDDFGNLMNPMLAEGQVHGGIAQGLGQAICEHVVYDPDGQLLTASLMDYGLPRAVQVPAIAFHSEPVPSTANVLGMKGCGEAGTVGAMAAVANAVLDAVWPLGLRHVEMPFTPGRLWAQLQTAGAAQAAE